MGEIIIVSHVLSLLFGYCRQLRIHFERRKPRSGSFLVYQVNDLLLVSSDR